MAPFSGPYVAELERPGSPRCAANGGGGTESILAADNRISEQANTETRDRRALSSLPHTFCMGSPYEG